MQQLRNWCTIAENTPPTWSNSLQSSLITHHDKPIDSHGNGNNQPVPLELRQQLWLIPWKRSINYRWNMFNLILLKLLLVIFPPGSLARDLNQNYTVAVGDSIGIEIPNREEHNFQLDNPLWFKSGNFPFGVTMSVLGLVALALVVGFFTYTFKLICLKRNGEFEARIWQLPLLTCLTPAQRSEDIEIEKLCATTQGFRPDSFVYF